MKYYFLIFLLLQGCAHKFEAIEIRGWEYHFLDGYGLTNNLPPTPTPTPQEVK